MQKTRGYTVQFDPKMYEAAKKKAEEEDRSIASLVRLAVKRYLEED